MNTKELREILKYASNASVSISHRRKSYFCYVVKLNGTDEVNELQQAKDIINSLKALIF